MCDFRGPPSKILVRSDNSTIRPEVKGSYTSITEVQNPEFGIYHIGASGCGYYLYDGDWVPIGKDMTDKYIFFRETYERRCICGQTHTFYNYCLQDISVTILCRCGRFV